MICQWYSGTLVDIIKVSPFYWHIWYFSSNQNFLKCVILPLIKYKKKILGILFCFMSNDPKSLINCWSKCSFNFQLKTTLAKSILNIWHEYLSKRISVSPHFYLQVQADQFDRFKKQIFWKLKIILSVVFTAHS